MQLSAREFTEHYPRHREWLKKAIVEILSGERAGFGVHEYLFARPRKPKVRLVGSIIPRENDYSGVIELKKVFILSQARLKGYGRALYSAVERYRRKYGYASIQTEVPRTELGTVAFLHKMGFRVNDCEPLREQPVVSARMATKTRFGPNTGSTTGTPTPIASLAGSKLARSQ